MAGKRRAEYDLNRDNWDEDLPKEDAGSWKPVSEEERKKRPVLKAKRSLTNTSLTETSSPFSGFSFSSPASNSSVAATPFANFSFTSKPVSPAVNTPEAPKPAVESPRKPDEPSILPTEKAEVLPKTGSTDTSFQAIPENESSDNHHCLERKTELEARKLKLTLAKQRIENELKEIEAELSMIFEHEGQKGSSMNGDDVQS